MMTLPFKDYPSFTEEITLSSVPFLFQFDWNTRGEYWTMRISDIEENILVAGVKLVPGIILTTQLVARTLPRGHFIVLHTANELKKIEYSDFVNDRVQLVFITEEEI